MFNNMLRQIRPIIYRLKKEYGLEAYIFHPETTTQDIETGIINRSYQITNIQKAVLLPINWSRVFNYDLSYIASGKNFVYGGFYDVGQRDMLLDVQDLPTDFELTNNDFIVFEEKRYEIKSIELAEHKQAYLLVVKEMSSYDDIKFVYNVVATGSEDVNYRITTNYFLNGSYNNHDAYCSYNGHYWIWFDDSSVASWMISNAKGTIGTFSWIKGDETLAGIYTPQGIATGTVNVSLI